MIYGYTRVSTVEQASGTSLDDQVNRIKGAALMRGDAVSEVFTDAGVSGSMPLRQRPAGGRLLDVLQPGDTLIVSKLDRIFRNAADALTMADEWKSRGVDLIITDMGVDPVTQNGVSKLFFGMLSCFAEFERDRIKERQKAGNEAKRAKNGFTGGKCPFGYRVVGTGKDSVLVPHEGEQQAISTIRELRGRGYSYQKIADELAASGMKASHMTVKRIVERDGQTA